MPYLVSAMLAIVGLIHLLPVSGALGSDRLRALYGLDFDEANLAILMRHRAVLFGLLGLFCIAAACSPPLQCAALLAGFASVISFLWLARSVGGYNAGIRRVVVADQFALACLMVGGIGYVYQHVAA